jgi:hypothetical protein
LPAAVRIEISQGGFRTREVAGSAAVIDGSRAVLEAGIRVGGCGDLGLRWRFGSWFFLGVKGGIGFVADALCNDVVLLRDMRRPRGRCESLVWMGFY